MEEKKSTSSERIKFVVAQAIFLVALIVFNRWLSESDLYKQGEGNQWRIGVNLAATFAVWAAVFYYQNRFLSDKPPAELTFKEKLRRQFKNADQQNRDAIDLLFLGAAWFSSFISFFSLIGRIGFGFRFGTVGFFIAAFLWSMSYFLGENIGFRRRRQGLPTIFSRSPNRPPRQIGYTVKYLLSFFLPIVVANILFRLNRSDEFRESRVNLFLAILVIVVFAVVSVRIVAGLWASIISFNRTYENVEGISWRKPLRYPLYRSEYVIVALGSFQLLYGFFLLPNLHKPLPKIDTYTPFFQALQFTIAIVLVNWLVSVVARRQRNESMD